MKNIVDEHAPVKTKRIRDHDVPYMTTKWKNAIQAKQKAEAEYQQNKTAVNLMDMQKQSYEAKKISNQGVLEDKIGRSEKKPSRFL